MKMKTIIFLVLITHLIIIEEAYGKSSLSYSLLPITESLEFIAAETTLRYNDSCTWNDEFTQREGFKKIQNLTMGSDAEQEILHDAIKMTEKRGVLYCGDVRMLVCSEETKRCVCGQTQAAVVLGDEYKPNAYIVENNVNEESTCRWAESTPCIPPGTNYNKGLDFYNVNIPPLKCATGLECVSTNEFGHKCSKEIVARYLATKFGKDAKNVTNGQLWEELLSGQVCICGKVEGR